MEGFDRPATSVSPVACTLTGAELGERLGALPDRLAQGRQEVRALPDGYALRYAADAAPDLLAIVAAERDCCPFLTFELIFAPDRGPLWFRLRGPAGAQAAIAAMLGLESPGPCPRNLEPGTLKQPHAPTPRATISPSATDARGGRASSEGVGTAMAEANGAATLNGAGHDAVDILIIGGGPTGLFAAFYAGLRGSSSSIVDSLEQPGGAVAAMYPEKYIYDVGGFPAILGKDLIANLVQQAGQFNPQLYFNERCEHLERLPDEGLFKLTTDKGAHYGRAVIICAGVGAFAPKKLDLPNLAEFEASGDIAYFVTRNEAYRDKRVLIVGGGDSAVDWALTLEPIARQVTLIHRSDNFRAHARSVEQLRASGVAVHTHCEVEELHGEGGKLRAVTFRHNKTKEATTIEVDAVIKSIGFVADLGPLKTWGLEIQKNQIVADPLTMGTNIEGIWAAGDIVTHPTKFKLIATGFHEAITAVNHAVHHLNPKIRLAGAHSTNLDLPMMKTP